MKWKNNITAETIRSGVITQNSSIAQDLGALNDMLDALHAGNISYGTCTTSASTVAKVITPSNNDWALVSGAMIVVGFSYTNTADSPTFNVNGTGAKPVAFNGSVITTSNKAYAGTANRPMLYMYDGTQYIFLGWSYYDDAIYNASSFGQGYAICETAESTTAKAATLSGYELLTNGIVAVKFIQAVPEASTLNVAGKGAKPIYYEGSLLSGGIIKAGDIATFIYNGSQYHLIAVDRWGADISMIDSVMTANFQTVNYNIATLTTNVQTVATDAASRVKTVNNQAPDANGNVNISVTSGVYATDIAMSDTDTTTIAEAIASAGDDLDDAVSDLNTDISALSDAINARVRTVNGRLPDSLGNVTVSEMLTLTIMMSTTSYTATVQNSRITAGMVAIGGRVTEGSEYYLTSDVDVVTTAGQAVISCATAPTSAVTVEVYLM